MTDEQRAQINRLVAEHVMGWERVHSDNLRRLYYVPEPKRSDKPATRARRFLPDFAGSWEGMGLVVEKLVETGYCPILVYDDDGSWALALQSDAPIGPRPEFATAMLLGHPDGVPWAVTPMMACALAALKAKGALVGDDTPPCIHGVPLDMRCLECWPDDSEPAS